MYSAMLIALPVRGWLGLYRTSVGLGLRYLLRHGYLREAVIRVAGNTSAPGAQRCFREVASKLGAGSTIEAILGRPPHDSLFPR